MKVALVNCFDTFLEREDSLRRFFLERGDEVTALVSDFCHIDKKTRMLAPNGYTTIHAKPYQKNLSVGRVVSHLTYAKAVASFLEEGAWDLIWVIAPPNALIAQCGNYRKRHPETRLVIDVNDLWPESFPIEKIKWLPPFWMWRRLRDSNIGEADAIVTECDLFRKKLNLPEQSSQTIYLCKQDAYSDVTERQPITDHIGLCYLGSINHIIDIPVICSILRSAAQTASVTLHVIGDGESRDQLLSEAAKAGAEVVYHGAVYDEAEKRHILNQCHFGLNVMKSSVCVGLTMKSMDYFAYGIPMINNIAGDTWELIECHRFGLNWTAADNIDWSTFDVVEAGRKARNFFERELTYGRFAQRVESVLEKL